LGEKLGIYKRAWKRWGWSGVRAAVSREREVHRLLTRERILGLDLVKAVKIERGGEAHETPADPVEESAPPASATEVEEEPTPEAVDGTPPPSENTEGLPLFGGDPEQS
jgi:hypothetical protein